MNNSSHDTELTALVDFLKNAWRFIHSRDTSKNPGEKLLAKRAWYLVIGPESVGKSKLIFEANRQSMPNTQPFAIDPANEATENKRCNLWTTKECIFLDAPGQYFSIDENNDHISWNEFLQQIQKYNRTKPFAGIILTLDVLTFSQQDKTKFNAYLQNIRKLLLSLTKFLNFQCPLFVVFTKLDKIAGFNEFFSDLGQEERNQPFGFDLLQSGNLNLANIFKARFEQMLKRLHERVIWRLHQERKPQKRSLIQNFPLQLESIQSNLATFIYQLSDMCSTQHQLPLQGIYFVSNCQEDESKDILQKTISQNLPIIAEKGPKMAAFPQSLTFFSQQFFKKTLTSKANVVTQQVNTKRNKKLKIIAYAIASSLIVTSSAVLAYNFNKKINLLNSAQIALTNYRLLADQLPQHDADLNQILPALNSLQQAVSDVDKAHMPLLLQDFTHVYSLKNLANKTYHEALTNYFLSGLSSVLEQILNSSQDPDMIYSAFRVYLMLGDPSHFDAQSINDWFNSYWNQTLANNPTMKQQLSSHLNDLLSSPIAPITLNQAIVAKTRAYLNTQPPVVLAYSIVKNESDDTKVNPFANIDSKTLGEVFVNNGTPIKISKIFTAAEFKSVYFDKIPEACNSVINGNDWVLGLAPRTVPTDADRQTLIGNAQQLYLRDYANNWQTLLVNLDIAGWENLQQADTTLTALLSAQSPLIHILRTLADNTTSEKLIASAPGLSSQDIIAIKSNLSGQFDGVADFLNGPATNNSFDQLLVNLTKLKQYIDEIHSADDVNESSFYAAKTHYLIRDNDALGVLIDSAATLPEPLRDWINSLASNTWRLVLENAQTYVNNLWQAKVVDIYNKKIANHYPLDKTSTIDLSLDAFTDFFAPDGIVDSFYKTYLAAFIDNSSSQWQAKRLDGQQLNFSTEFLQQLERASIIRTMYFGTSTVPNVMYSLQPSALEPSVQQFTLDINHQTIQSTQSSVSTPITLTWPGSSNSDTITMTFITQDGQKMSSTFHGPWALFRLLDQSNVQVTPDTKNYDVTFDLNGNSARYQLQAANVINPFIPGIVSSFQCPTQINNN